MTLTYELVLAMVLGWTPPSLSPFVLYISWTNKIGHSRKADNGQGMNAHVDHHTRHNLNYGIYYGEAVPHCLCAFVPTYVCTV